MRGGLEEFGFKVQGFPPNAGDRGINSLSCVASNVVGKGQGARPLCIQVSLISTIGSGDLCSVVTLRGSSVEPNSIYCVVDHPS